MQIKSDQLSHACFWSNLQVDMQQTSKQNSSIKCQKIT